MRARQESLCPRDKQPFLIPFKDVKASSIAIILEKLFTSPMYTFVYSDLYEKTLNLMRIR